MAQTTPAGFAQEHEHLHKVTPSPYPTPATAGAHSHIQGHQNPTGVRWEATAPQTEPSAAFSEAHLWKVSCCSVGQGLAFLHLRDTSSTKWPTLISFIFSKPSLQHSTAPHSSQEISLILWSLAKISQAKMPKYPWGSSCWCKEHWLTQIILFSYFKRAQK